MYLVIWRPRAFWPTMMLLVFGLAMALVLVEIVALEARLNW